MTFRSDRGAMADDVWMACCDVCGDPHPVDDLTAREDGRIVCADCLEAGEE